MSEKNEKEIINIEDFFTVDNEKEGVWFEPKINGNPCGIEFLVTGVGTDANIAASERFEKELAKLEELKDPIERSEKRKVLDANRVAEQIKGIRPADGKNLMFNGKPLEYSVPLIQQIMLKSPLIKVEIVKFAVKTENFIKGEKNA